ncbi:terminase small subunit [Macrococcus equi]|uniref:terminase small subunit n=1 Tax=Macrococcus equi TaxID=3395462 RepID=UPI0039BDE431
MKKLTDKQKRFANEYLKHLNATKSAKLAGYSEKTAYSIGNELLKKPEIKEYIDSQKKLIMDQYILDTKEVLYLLSRIARGEELEEKEVIIKRAEFMTNPDTKRQNIVYNENVEKVYTEPKISDKNKALELLGKYHVLWTDKVNLSDFEPVIIVDSIPVKEEDDENE